MAKLEKDYEVLAYVVRDLNAGREYNLCCENCTRAEDEDNIVNFLMAAKGQIYFVNNDDSIEEDQKVLCSRCGQEIKA